ncbi:MAG TPA: hypothetical protein VEB22_00260, partial [Phycisphaerales bacterium]|nr:hypothetical protein [Phycisphaerales bacterium]
MRMTPKFVGNGPDTHAVSTPPATLSIIVAAMLFATGCVPIALRKPDLDASSINASLARTKLAKGQSVQEANDAAASLGATKAQITWVTVNECGQPLPVPFEFAARGRVNPPLMWTNESTIHFYRIWSAWFPLAWIPQNPDKCRTLMLMFDAEYRLAHAWLWP